MIRGTSEAPEYVCCLTIMVCGIAIVAWGIYVLLIGG